MSMTKLAAGIGAAALAATLSLPATAAESHAGVSKSAITDVSAARHHDYARHHVWRGHSRVGIYHRRYWGPRYGYYDGYSPYYGGPHAYVSLPFVNFGIW